MGTVSVIDSNHDLWVGTFRGLINWWGGWCTRAQSIIAREICYGSCCKICRPRDFLVLLDFYAASNPQNPMGRIKGIYFHRWYHNLPEFSKETRSWFFFFPFPKGTYVIHYLLVIPTKYTSNLPTSLCPHSHHLDQTSLISPALLHWFPKWFTCLAPAQTGYL